MSVNDSKQLQECMKCGFLQTEGHCRCCDSEDKHDEFGDILKCCIARDPNIAHPKTLADRLRVNAGTMSRWINKETSPNRTNLVNLAKWLRPEGKELDKEQRNALWSAAVRGKFSESEDLDECLSEFEYEYSALDPEEQEAKRERLRASDEQSKSSKRLAIWRSLTITWLVNWKVT